LNKEKKYNPVVHVVAGAASGGKFLKLNQSLIHLNYEFFQINFSRCCRIYESSGRV
jgi:hypothetical protein